MKKEGNNFCHLIKRTGPIFILLFFIFIELQFAEGNILSIKGKEGFPYFDLQGSFKIVYINSYGGISIATVRGEENTEKIYVQDINYANNINNIRAKKDKAGRIWLAWEEKKPEKSDIYVARLKNKRIVNQISLTTDRKGFNFSPHIDFSFRNELWIAWVNYFQKKYTILVKNITTDQIWEINPSLTSSAHSPHIIIDGTENIWLFWVGQLRGRDEILYTNYDGERWRESLSLNQYSDVPHITPSISLDYNGLPHIVWSAYDGDDYELYYSYWDGIKWIQEKRITNNQNIADTYPSISLLLDTIPIVVWSRYTKGKREVCLSYKSGEEWSSEINISGDKNITNPPKLVSLRDRIGVSWQVNKEIKTILMHFNKLQEFFFLKKRNTSSPWILPINFFRILALDKDKYICFGDSITYGIIAYEAAPELGYVPRLEKLIDENIRDSEAINRGIGGEKTAEALSRINSVINEDQSKTIFLMEGTNDVKDETISMDTAAFNLEQMVERCLSFEMTVFLASIIKKDLWEYYKERILGLNEKIESIASSLNIDFVDQFEAFWINQDLPGGLYSDATHPNEQGYQIMAETWYEALINTLPSIEIDPTSLSFEGIKKEPNPPPKKFKIRNSGAGTLNYQINDNRGWISISPSSGNSKGEWDEIEILVDISNLSKGNYQGNVTITSEYASNSPQKLTVNLTIKLPLLFPPLNFHGEKKANRSLSQLEYINVLNWEANPQNKFIEKFKIYLIEEGNKTLLKEFDAQTFEYWHRKVKKDKVYKYGLTAGDKFERESEPVYIEVR